MEPVLASKKHLVDAPVSIEILGELRRDTSINKDNLKLDDVDLAVEELGAFKKSGGKCLWYPCHEIPMPSHNHAADIQECRDHCVCCMCPSQPHQNEKSHSASRYGVDTETRNIIPGSWRSATGANQQVM